MGMSAELTTMLSASVGIGGAPFGNLSQAGSDDAAVATIRHALASGVRYFDTAPHYGNGLSEHRYGAALRDVPRDTYVLSTKVGRLLRPDPSASRDQNGYVAGLPFVQRFDYSHDGALRSLDDSLQRLGLARVDMAYVHDIDVATHGANHPARFHQAMNGAIPALARLKAEGVLGGYGIGVNDVQSCLDTLAATDIGVILLAGRYTLADQSGVLALSECRRRKIAVVAGGPFNSGILATGSRPRDGTLPYFNYLPAPAHVIGRVAQIESACAEFAVPLQAAALQFPAAHPAVVNVLVGPRSVAELDANLAHARFPIPSEFWQTLRERELIDCAAPIPGEPIDA